LFSKDGTIGKTYLVEENNDFVVLSSLAIIRPNTELILPKFLEYYLKTDFCLGYVRKLMGGSALQRIILKNIKEIIVPKIDISTQQKLVAMMDEAYSLKKQKEQKAKELLDSIDDFVMGELGIKFSSLRSTHEVGEVDNHSLEKSTPSGFQPTTPQEGNIFGVKLSTLGRFDVEYNLPKNKKLMKCLKNSKYEYKEIKKVSDFVSGYAFKSSDYVESGIPLIRIQDIDEKVSPFDSSKHLPLNYSETYNKFLVKENDILISMTGGVEGDGRVGKIAFVKEEKIGLLNQRCGIIRAKNNINIGYLFAFLNTNIFRTLLVNEAVISVQVNVSENDITNLLIPLPPLEIQQKIADEVEKRRSQAFELQAEARQVLETAKKEFEREVLIK
jgi:restriction endonuclease S subunit